MKTTSQKTAKGVILLTALVFLLSGTLNAQRNAEKFDKNAVGNLISGIKSDNEGLKRNSIYFAGKYKVEETVEVLTEQLKTETDAADKILIALSLYQIGNSNGLEAVKQTAKNDTDERVKAMCEHIYTQYLNDKKFSSLNK